ncbi:MAG TPA: hypothetical protein VFX55_00990 [Duganella sp.]|nr:hypothetical protein [Duganella sp.]
MNTSSRIEQYEQRVAAAIDDFTAEVRWWIIFFGALNASLLIVAIVIA